MRLICGVRALLLITIVTSPSCMTTEVGNPTGSLGDLSVEERVSDNRDNLSQRAGWKTAVASEQTVFLSISFRDAMNGIASGSSEYYFVTADGGMTWKKHKIRERNFESEEGEYSLVLSAVSSSGSIYAIGALENSGSAIFSARAPNDPWNIDDKYLRQSLNDLSVIGDQAWVVGNGERFGYVLKTLDGIEWEKVWESNEHSLAGVSFLNESVGWAVGGDGAILHTVDGGRTWTAQQSKQKENLLSVAFADPQNGYAVGVKGTILHTSNGGRTWEKQLSGTDNSLIRVAVAGSDVAWAIGQDRMLLQTTDGGVNWKKSPLPSELNEYDANIYDITISGKKVWLATQSRIMVLEINR